MATCDFCEQEMIQKVSCKKAPITIDGKEYDQILVDENLSYKGFCHDCAAPVGGYHHPGCDAERCPKCGGQIISCDCQEIS